MNGLVIGGDVQGEDREELDFQFDEELDKPLPVVKQNTFTEWSDSDDSECDEVSDEFINKVKEKQNSHTIRYRINCNV